MNLLEEHRGTDGQKVRDFRNSFINNSDLKLYGFFI